MIMKKMTKIYFGILLSVMAVSLQAFGQESSTAGTYKHANWFLTVGAGAQAYWAENYCTGNFGNRITPDIEVAVGKWFTHVWGARIQYDGYKMKGFCAPSNPYATGGRTPKGGFQEQFNYMDLHFDILFNLNSAICPYSRRVYELIPYVGAGYARSSENNTSFSSYSINGGLINRFRVSHTIDLNLTLKAMIVNEGFDKQEGGIKLEGSTGVTAGFTVKF